MATEDDPPHVEADATGHAVLAAAGEAVAFFAGAPIAGAADAAVGLGDAVTGREAQFEDAMTGRHASDGPARKRLSWVWLVAIVLVVAAALVWALEG